MADAGRERRFIELRKVEGRRLSGIAVTYGDTATLPFGRERFEPGAFGDVGELDVVLNVQHQRSRPLARTGGGGLELADSATELRIAAELPETREAEDTLTLIRSGVLRGLSIEFSALKESMAGGVRSIERAALHGIGVVDSPAYPQSSVAARERGASRRRRLWL